MPRIYQAVDHVETVTDTLMEQFGNDRDYHVNAGCEPSYSATDMVVTVSAGGVTHNGTRVTVAEDTVTLVADSTHPRWAYIGVDSTGGAVVVHGTAAADPVPPELGDYVEVALVRIEAGQTIANACEHKIDKRMIGKQLVTLATGGGANTASLVEDVEAVATLGAVKALTIPLLANSIYAFEALLSVVAGSQGQYFFGFRAPTGGILRVFTLDGTALDQDPLFFLASFDSGEQRTLAMTGVITTTTAGDLVCLHAGAGFRLKAKSRVELQ